VKKHIPGAINISLDPVASRASVKFDIDEEIVVYCKYKACGASPKEAKKLEKLGFENVYYCEGGLAEWENTGHKVES
jgi:rhodanese-related sulfurtransferase